MKKYLVSIVVVSLMTLALSQTLPTYTSIYTSSAACTIGRQQSPVALTDEFSLYNVTVYPVFSNYFPVLDAKLDWSADGRVLQVTGGDDMNSWGVMGLERKGVLRQYLLKSIEVSFPGEHTVEGVTPDIEIKLIHEKSLSFQTTVNQYRRIPDGNTFLTISLLYKRDGSVPDNGFAGQLAASFAGPAFNMDIDSYGLIANKKFYFYEGSFTADPCDEVVNRIVIRDFFKLTDDAYNVIKNQYAAKYNGGKAAKPVAELYGREILRNFVMNTTEASTSFLQLSYLLAFLFVFIF